MKKYDIYIVWYHCDLGRAMWGVYPTEEQANDAITYIQDNQIGVAWCNGEMFGPCMNAM